MNFPTPIEAISFAPTPGQMFYNDVPILKIKSGDHPAFSDGFIDAFIAKISSVNRIEVYRHPELDNIQTYVPSEHVEITLSNMNWKIVSGESILTAIVCFTILPSTSNPLKISPLLMMGPTDKAILGVIGFFAICPEMSEKLTQLSEPRTFELMYELMYRGMFLVHTSVQQFWKKPDRQKFLDAMKFAIGEDADRDYFNRWTSDTKPDNIDPRSGKIIPFKRKE